MFDFEYKGIVFQVEYEMGKVHCYLVEIFHKGEAITNCFSDSTLDDIEEAINRERR